MAFVRTGEILLHYRVQGLTGAPVLVLVNSLGTDARIWDEVITELLPHYRIVSYDKRGHGLSDAPAGDYSLDDHVADLVGLLDHLGVAQSAVAGVSVGGLIAQGFALRHSDRIAGLVLCDTAPKIGDAPLWDERIAAVQGGGMEALADAVMLRWFTERYRRDSADALAGWRNMLARTPAEGYIGTCATLRNTDLRNDIAGIAAPTLVVVGDADVATPVELVRETAACIPGARFEIVPDAGHIPSIEQPGRLSALMKTYFNEVGHG
ncbi:3-oxoadipate enol-lactonase [Devosia nitrariae]|uniref:3-oxoadipate enol-lactonase n=1 Tax=Devosia nitrariae TaxID=2071872 RepID=A0ABQ5W5Y3_9HYPH|nr:3-oxoadipate enol-lactonase [Devosia nitrariae]GLQ55392.1 3-oxoadipate enol-lactonase [Devosia nitrariae]